MVTADAFDNATVTRFERGGVLSFLFGFSRYTLEYSSTFLVSPAVMVNQGISKVN